MRHLLFLLLPAFFLACNEDFDITAPAKDIPVVYGLVDISDTATYFRIERVYVSDDLNAIDVAQNPDSLYYPADALTVKLENISGGGTVTLTRVDGALEGYPREGGAHASEPNILYKFKKSQFTELEADQVLKLTIMKDEEVLTEAQTAVVGEYYVNYSSMPSQLIFTNPDFTLSFGTLEKTATLYDVQLYFHYEENSATAPDVFTQKTLTWDVKKGLERAVNQGVVAPTTNVKTPSSEFYQYLRDNISPANGLTRHFLNIQFAVDAGGAELSEYRKRLLANSGITGTQAVPSFTNLTNGIGVVTSKSRLVSNPFPMAIASRDSLKNGSYTKNLGFQ